MKLILAESLSFRTALLSFVCGSLAAMFLELLLRRWRRREQLVPTSIFIPRGYTLEELAAYDGVRKPYAFIAVRGIIYNCSLDFYGPNAPYNAFAGRDSSRNLGKMEVGQQEANIDWTTLSPLHLKTLFEWETRLRSKYEVVGWVIAPEDFCRSSEKVEP
ncbi:unnamed protein product [Trypanosoma congolense IL3000]|uniref:WGS project CAEQ00000000 data, annotated contig 825 n=1 Tax=Trypanosoma congolense (strain IL3000) TaxID=1068625 RepID=F9WIS2_TRYCI|nr:unnamed protein product [Trypanosoma congolense IL3000]